MSEVKTSIIKLGQVIGIGALALVVFVSISLAGPGIHDFFIKPKPDRTREILDSTRLDAALARQEITFLKAQLAGLTKRIDSRDSSMDINQKTVTNEIKSLRAADNRIKLAIGDSILRARAQGLH